MNAWEEIPITDSVMRYVKAHLTAVRPWTHGKPIRAYLEAGGRISVTYEDYCWWFYRCDGGRVVWE